MAEKIDSLLVELGLDTDRRSFEQGMSAFNEVRSAALQLTAALGVGFGLNEVTFGFARANDVIGKFADNLGVSEQFVDGLAYALERSGGNATDAFGTIQSLADLMAGIRMGDTSALEEAARWGFDPNAVLQADSLADAMERIADATAGMDPMARRNVLNALGLGSQAEMTLLGGGSDGIRSYIAEAEKLSPVTRRHAELSAELNDETLRLSRAFRGLRDEISLRVIPGMVDFLQLMTRIVTGEEGESAEQFQQRFGGDDTDSLGRVANFVRSVIGSDDAPATLPRASLEGGPARPGASTPWSDLARPGIDQGADTWIPDVWPETLDSIQQMLEQDIPGGIGGDLSPEELNYQPSPSELIPPGNRSELREGNLRLMREHFPERYQGSNQTHNWYITGTNAREIGEEVNRVLAQHASQAARDWQEPYA